MIDTVVPRFANLSDQIWVKAVLHNTSGASGEFEVALTLNETPRFNNAGPGPKLTGGLPVEAIEVLGITAEMSRAQRVAWDELQNELTALSDRGKRLIATQSGHVIQLDQPQLVIDAVADMVAELRTAELSGGK